MTAPQGIITLFYVTEYETVKLTIMNNAFSKLFWSGVLITLALLATSKTNAETIVLSSFTNLVTQHAQDYPELGGASVNYSTSNIIFTNYYNGQVITSNPKFSLVYTSYKFGEWPRFGAEVGGFDGVGTSATGWFNVASTNFAGLYVGESANSSENGDIINGHWVGFVDLNGNGIYGTREEEVHGGYIIDIEPGEMIADVTVFNFQPLQTGAGTLSAGSISGVYGMPDLSTASIRLGTTAASIGQNNTFTFAVCTTNLSFFRVEHNDCLTNATWTSLAQYNVTGAVTFVTDTNAVPQRYYRAVAP